MTATVDYPGAKAWPSMAQQTFPTQTQNGSAGSGAPPLSNPLKGGAAEVVPGEHGSDKVSRRRRSGRV